MKHALTFFLFSFFVGMGNKRVLQGAGMKFDVKYLSRLKKWIVWTTINSYEAGLKSSPIGLKYCGAGVTLRLNKRILRKRWWKKSRLTVLKQLQNVIFKNKGTENCAHTWSFKLHNWLVLKMRSQNFHKLIEK